MKVTVLGAVGGTGQQVVRQLLDANHDVTAFFRPSASLPETLRPVREVRAEPGDRDAIRDAVRGADTVICAVGCDQKIPTQLSFALRAVLDVMEETVVRRLVALSSAPAAPGHQKTLFDQFVAHPMLDRLFGDRLRDMRRMEAMLVQSAADWTVIRAPWQLTDGPATGQYRTAVDIRLRRIHTISRADLASALICAAFDDQMIGHIVTVSY
jgi:putative NADH-flavin reductase